MDFSCRELQLINMNSPKDRKVRNRIMRSNFWTTSGKFCTTMIAVTAKLSLFACFLVVIIYGNWKVHIF